MSRVRLTTDAGIGRATLARPAQRNALDRAAAVELTNALKRLDADGAVRVVVVDAEGEDFCAGADLDALAGTLDAGRQAQADDAQALGRAFVTLRGMMKPTVALVQGRALAGGAALATACDVVLAAESASFGYPEAPLGLVPAVGLAALRRAVGEKRAAELVLTGRTVSGAEAERIGLASRVLPDAGFREAADAIVRRMAHAPELAMALTKRLLYHVDALDFRDGVAAGVKTDVEARGTAEFRAAVQRAAAEAEA